MLRLDIEDEEVAGRDRQRGSPWLKFSRTPRFPALRQLFTVTAMSSLMPVSPSLKTPRTDVVQINPKPFLQDLTGKSIVVKLKCGQEYHGRLNAVDSYMNLKLTGTEEWREGKNEGMLGEVFIRCNNVLWVSESSGEKTQED